MGYQGSERDDEVSGGGNSYTTFFRGLNPRLGRWLSIDPKYKHNESPYADMGNNPIYFIDPLGDDIIDGRGKNAKKVEVTRDANGKLKYKFDESYSEKKRHRIEKRFMRRTAPILEEMNQSEAGYEDIMKLNNMPTQVYIGAKRGVNLNANSDLFGSNERLSDGSYKRVEIYPYLGNYDKKSGFDFAEYIGMTMNVEVGHLDSKQIELEAEQFKKNPFFVTQTQSAEFIKAYTPLLNNAVRFRLRYRQEKNQKADLSVFEPLDSYNIPYDADNLAAKKKILQGD